MVTSSTIRKRPLVMSPLALLKVLAGNHIKTGVIISLFCVLVVFLSQVFFTRQATNHQDAPYIGLQLNQNMNSGAKEFRNIISNSLMLSKKLLLIKKDLNYSVLTKEGFFPAKIIRKYLLLDPNLCRGVDRIDTVIIVHTAPENLERRQCIRDSFANSSLLRPFEIRLAFLLGQSTNKTLERILWNEHSKYKDTVMGEFIDNYYNLSIKGAMGFRWVNQYCSNSEFVLKIDDDVMVNMFNILYSFRMYVVGKKKSIFCNFIFTGTMPILREGKWKVDSHIFSSQQMFPYDYCSGFAVIMTSDLMGPLHEAALITPFFWIDDVYLFGMLPLVVGKVTFYNCAQQITLNIQYAIKCILSLGHRCSIFATHDVKCDGKYWRYWDLIKRTYAPTQWEVVTKVVH